jgi:hypothetical protein
MTAIGILIGISAERKETPTSEGWYKAPSLPPEIDVQPEFSTVLDDLDDLGSIEESSVEADTFAAGNPS